MSVLKSFQDYIVALNDIHNAALDARFGVVKLLTVLEEPTVTDQRQKDGGCQNNSFCFSDTTTCFDGSRGTTIDINDTFYKHPSTSSGNTISVVTPS